MMSSLMSSVISSLDLFPSPLVSNTRTLRELNERLDEGLDDCVVIDETTIYPSIEVKAENIIKPSVTNERVENIFISREVTLWTQFIRCFRNYGFISSLQLIHDYDNYEEIENNRFLRFSQKGAQIVLYFWHLLLTFYVFLYPFALKSNEELSQEFSKSIDWTNGLIRAFEWHPNCVKCAVCLINDCIYVYSADNSFVPLLKHSLQTKVTALSWSPTKEDTLAVSCVSAVLIWTVDPNSRQYRPSNDCIYIISTGIASPLTDLKFHPNGQYLAACCPQSSKLFIIDVDKKEVIKTVRRFGTCFTKLFWSPNGNRLLVTTTLPNILVFETNNWSSGKWSQPFTDVCQTSCWSRPNDHILLVAPRDSLSVFAIPFYDSPQLNDVGGVQKFIEVINVCEQRFPNGLKVGGSIHDMVWDKNSERLALSFKENNRFIALYKTIIRPNLEITPIGFVHGLSAEIPLLISFHDCFQSGSLLTVCWNSGVVSYIPLQFEAKANKSLYTNGTPRSLTSFCISTPNMKSPFNGTPKRHSKQMNTSLLHFTPNESVLSPKRPFLFSNLRKVDSNYESIE